MLYFVILFYFLHQSRGYGIKLHANVDIGDEGLASIFKDIAQNYLKNGLTEIDFTELVNRMQLLSSTETSQPMKLVADEDEFQQKNTNKVKEPIETKIDIRDNNVKTNKFNSINDDKALHAEKKLEIDDFSDDSIEVMSKELHKPRKISKKRKPSESGESSADSADKEVKKKRESKKSKSKISKRENRKKKLRSGHHKREPSNKFHADPNEANDQVKNSNKKEHDKHEMERTISNDDNTKSKHRKTKAVNEALLLKKMKEAHESIHIYGTHEGVAEVMADKYPLNNIQV